MCLYADVCSLIAADFNAVLNSKNEELQEMCAVNELGVVTTVLQMGINCDRNTSMAINQALYTRTVRKKHSSMETKPRATSASGGVLEPNTPGGVYFDNAGM